MTDLSELPMDERVVEILDRAAEALQRIADAQWRLVDLAIRQESVMRQLLPEKR